METIAAPEFTSQLIERPRLLAELDAAEARGVRAICLVAPAGYGKTVLAEQWVRSRHPDAIWHYATEASSDVACLAQALASAAHPLVPEITELVARRVRASRRSDAFVSDLAATLGNAFTTIPSEPWIVIDDLHLLGETYSSALVQALLNSRTCRLVLVTRRRPSFLSARRILYQEGAVIGHALLAFDTDELIACRALVRSGEETEGVRELPSWPVLTRLALNAGPTRASASDHELFAFIAEDVLSSLSEGARDGLTILSVSPHVDVAVATALLGDLAQQTVSEGVMTGMLLRTAEGAIRMHATVRAFLSDRFVRLPAQVRQPIVKAAFRYWLRRRDFESAIAIAETLDEQQLAMRGVRTAYRSALNAGRHETVQRWISLINPKHPLTLLVRAELAVACGNLDEAMGLAASAGAASALRPRDRARALCVASLAAYVSGRGEQAEQYGREALGLARTPGSRSEALWASFRATNLTEGPEAEQLLTAFRAAESASATTRLRYAVGQLSMSSSPSGWINALPEAGAAAGVANDVEDPAVRVSFWCTLGDVATDAGEVQLARRALDAAATDAQSFGLVFAEPRIRLLQGRLDILERRFSRAKQRLQAAQAGANDDADVLLGCATSAFTLAISQRHATAGILSPPRTGVGSKYLRAQFLAWSAFEAAMAAGTDWERLASEAVATSNTPYVKHVVSFAHAVALIRLARPDAQTALLKSVEQCLARGDVFHVVTLYRACPEILPILLLDEGLALQTTDIVGRFDPGLGSDHGILPPSTAQVQSNPLSPREREVLAMLTEGLTNREIAKRLFISEATAKVHVRRICSKPGVRSRTEAVLVAVS